MSLSRLDRVDLIRRQVHIPRTVDIARARLLTQSYKETEGQPMPIRRSKALRKILSEMPIYIHDGQLIVGNQGERSRAGLIFPEFQWDITLHEMETWETRPGDRFIITKEQQTELKDLLEYWKGKTVKDLVFAALPEEIKTSLEMGVLSNANYLMSGHGHFIPNFQKILTIGFEGVRREILEKVAELESTSPSYYGKLIYYRGLLYIVEAVLYFAQRFADLAAELARKQNDSTRKVELWQISKNCRNVPRYPARSFWEALQSVWFAQLIPQIEVNGLAVSLGRFDQYLYPFYKNDLSAGVIDKERALELLDCFYLQASTITKIYSNEGAMLFAGPGVGQTITLSGVDCNGQDATNELSYLCLDADADVHLMQPDIAIRSHPLIPESFLSKACQHISSGRDKPKFFNDRVVVQALQNTRVPLEDARDYGVLGCSEAIVQGKSCSGGNCGNLALIRCLEYALSDGVAHWWYDGKNFHENVHVQTGIHTGDPRGFASFEDVVKAYETQVEFFMNHMVVMDNIIDNVQAKLVPHMFYSLVTDGCIESGIDFTQGGAIYNYTSPAAIAPINVADSLAAVKKLIFEEQRLSMDELIDAIRSNLAGEKGEAIRCMLIRQAPKYGNDDLYVDELAAYVIRNFANCMKPFRNPRGGTYVPSVYSLTGNIGFGWRTGPTPDGRRGGEILNDNISPMQGMDLNGPTAVIKSLSMIDAAQLPQGYIFNLKFAPNILEDEKKLQKFVDFNRALGDFGIFHVQYNVLGAEVLVKAQKEPEKYRDLLVRVSGYSAYFVELGKDVQDHLIKRTEHVI